MTRGRCYRLSCLLFTLPIHAEPARADAGTEACIRASEDALLQRKENRLIDARASLSTCAASACPEVVRASCALRLVEINASIPSVTFAIEDGEGRDRADVAITVDGRAYPGHAPGSALTLDPGAHFFLFEAAGAPAVSRRFVLVQGDQNRRETIVFAAPVTRWSAPQTMGVVLGAVGVAGLLAGGISGALSIHTHHTYEGDCGSAIGAPAGQCTAAGVSGAHDATREGTVSTIAFVAGGAALAAGAIVFFTAPRGGSNLQIGLTVNRVVFGGRF